MYDMYVFMHFFIYHKHMHVCMNHAYVCLIVLFLLSLFVCMFDSIISIIIITHTQTHIPHRLFPHTKSMSHVSY